MNIRDLARTSDSWGLLVLRVTAGIIYVAHGLPKFGLMGGKGQAALAGYLGSIGVPLPQVSAFLVASSEVFGGALIIVGFLTRLASLTHVVAMLVAVFVVHWSNGLMGDGGYQWALLLLAGSLCLLLDGAGRLSIDRKLMG